ncbi:unnamed protein product [Nippostrongylus brasiliensis]|uniref:DNA-binding protein n=1 Tax=Nippostrongylus brasiliensis TaxID=27835 RepID=A0A0N4YYY0_NIPBR|nr:unnamed protein product [Nippostrongylus brasiliensis]
MPWSKKFWSQESPYLNPMNYYVWSVVERIANETKHLNVTFLRTTIKALYVNGKHTNRKNRGCYEVYHEYLGYIRDTFNLLSRVDEATLVPITAQRRHCTAEGGELVWQIIALREQASE